MTTVPLTGNQHGQLIRDEWLRRQGLRPPPMLARHAIRLRGHLDVPALESALSAVVERHEALRTCVRDTMHGPVQSVYPSAALPLHRCDLTRSANPAADLAGFITRIAGQPLPLDQPPLMRAGLATLSATEHVFVLAAEHLIADGWSQWVVLREIAEFYAAALGEGSAPAGPAPSWLEWTMAERAWADAGGAREEAEIWREALTAQHEITPPCPAPPSSHKHVAAGVSAMVDAATSRAFQGTLADCGGSLAAGLLTCFGMALGDAAGRDRTWVAIPVLNRSLDTEEHLVGWVANQRPAAVTIEQGAAFDEIVQDVQMSMIDAVEHGRGAIDELIRHLDPDRWGRVPPLLAAFAPPYDISPAFFGLEVAAEPVDVPVWTMGIELECCWQPDESLELGLIWDSGVFPEHFMTAMLKNVEQTLAAATTGPSVPPRS